MIDRLAADLRREFPDMKGFSARNLKYMQAFAGIYTEASFVQQLAAQIPWYHNGLLMDKVKDPLERAWYIRKTIEHGWSRHVLAVHIESGLYQREGRAISNFTLTLPAPQSDLAVCANLAEAWRKRRYKAAFVSKLNDTEAAETQTWVAFAVECKYLDAVVGRDRHRLSGAGPVLKPLVFSGGGGGGVPISYSPMLPSPGGEGSGGAEGGTD